MSYVGKRVERQDAAEKVAGRARYVDDYRPDGCLHGATVRSEVPHGRITAIHVADAEGAPGVEAVLTAEGVPGSNRLPLVVDDYPLLAEGQVRFVGQAVALVAAASPAEARAAAALVKVEVEPLPAVFDPLEALAEGAAEVAGEGNVFKRFSVMKGDPDGAFAECAAVVEQVFETAHQVHAYLETQGMVAEPDGLGGIFLTGTMQCPYYVLDAVSSATGLGRNRVQVVQAETGGAFGGKEDVPSIVAAHAAMLCQVTGRPVKIVYDREEDFTSMSKRHPGWARVKYGASREGKLLACEADYVLNGGAYTTLSPIVLFRGTAHATGPYDVGHVKVTGRAAATNTVPCGAFRGFGQPQIAFAQESALDLLAAKLEMDPAELRAKNMLRPGATTATGQRVTESCGLPEALERVRAACHWDEKRAASRPAAGETRRGLGVATAYYGVGLGAGGRAIDRAAAAIQVEKDGTVQVSVGNTEMGQGARSELAQIAADALGAPLESVWVRPVDTSRVPDSGPTVASRTTISSGKAILNASAPIRRRIEGVARRLLDATEVVVDEGVIRGGSSELPFAEVVAACYGERQPMSSVGTWVSPDTSFDEEGQGDAYASYSFSATAAEVDVDTGTGEVRVRDIWTAVDVGHAINPDQVEAQLEGGVVQAAGYALMEELHLMQGRIDNPDLGRYIIPTSLDVPKIHPIIVEAHYGGGPFGAKGFGEIPMIGTPAAIANAVADAIGVAPKKLPVTPERVLDLLDEAEGRRPS